MGRGTSADLVGLVRRRAILSPNIRSDESRNAVLFLPGLRHKVDVVSVPISTFDRDR